MFVYLYSLLVHVLDKIEILVLIREFVINEGFR